MKAIINGKRYNTETAQDLSVWSNGYSTTDFNYCRETLYRTKNGAHFLYGTGGAMSKYRESYGDSWGGGSKIIPLTEAEAIKWLEEHDGTSALEEHFPDHIQDA
jgi:hypothetical protein